MSDTDVHVLRDQLSALDGRRLLASEARRQRYLQRRLAELDAQDDGLARLDTFGAIGLPTRTPKKETL